MGAPSQEAPLFVSPIVAPLTRRALADGAAAPERGPQRVAVVPLLAALLAGEPLTREERGVLKLEVLRGWRAPRQPRAGPW